MGKRIQAKGMEHIRNLKKEARIMWKEYDQRHSLWLDCIEASMLQHRFKCLEEKKRNLENQLTGNPS